MRKLIAIALIFVSTICNAQQKLDSVTVTYDRYGNVMRSEYYSTDKMKSNEKGTTDKDRSARPLLQRSTGKRIEGKL